MFSIIQYGGLLMIPLLLMSVILLAAGIERLFFNWRYHISSSFQKKMESALHERGMNGLLHLLQEHNSPSTAIFREIQNRRHRPIEDIEKRISIKGALLLRQLKRHLHLFDLIGRIAPMTGLFGTVTGLAGSFMTISSVEGAVNASVLAGDIWEAMITTIVGLLIGIPALILDHFFRNRVKDYQLSIEVLAEEAIALVTGESL